MLALAKCQEIEDWSEQCLTQHTEALLRWRRGSVEGGREKKNDLRDNRGFPPSQLLSKEAVSSGGNRYKLFGDARSQKPGIGGGAENH